MALGFFPDRYFPAGFLSAACFGDYGTPTIAVQEAAHGHTADTVTLTQIHVLVVQETSDALAGESP